MINLWVDKNRLLASYEVNDQIEVRDLGPAEYTAFARDKNALSWDQNIMSRKPDFDGWWKFTFFDYDTRKLACESNPGILFEGDVSPVRRFISDHKVNIDRPKRCYLDIETDSDVPFTQAIDGYARLLSFAVVDEAGTAVSGILHDDSDEDEARLWNELWTIISRFSQVNSWGGDRFDFAVLEKRSQMLCRRFKAEFQPFWENRRRLLFLDQYLLFKRHHMAPESGDDKCLAPGTPVIKFDGTVINVEDVVDGDLLMGPDSLPRTVSYLHRGRGEMYRIKPVKGESWECNRSHILTVVDTTGKYGVRDISVAQLLEMTPSFRARWKLFQPEGGVEFLTSNTELPVDPYFLGLWLGDGTKDLNSVDITTKDQEVVVCCKIYALKIDQDCSVQSDPRNGVLTVRIAAKGTTTRGPIGEIRRARSNPLLDKLRALMSDGTKIPAEYLTASRQNRLDLLAGLIDSDGHLQHGSFLFTQKCTELTSQVEFLARSLGLAAIRSHIEVNGTIYQRTNICGHTAMVPTRLPRKQASVRKQVKNALRVGFEIERIEDGDFHGFSLDGDCRFLLGNFVVTHNTSFKLGDVGQALIGEGKDEVPEDLKDLLGKKTMGGSTRKLWDLGGAARQAMLDYNIQDAQLQRKIEEEVEYLELQQTIAEVTHTFVNTRGIMPMSFVDAYMLKNACQRKTHLPSKLEPTGEEKVYEGAFVMDTTIKGILRTIHVCDFKSLYPTVIRTWNLGAETKGIPGCTSANGINFGIEKESMLAECCRAFMDLRKYWADKKKTLTPGTPEYKAADRKSKAYKIANNSVYGVGGCVWSRIYDVEIVEAITLGAQMLLKATRDAAIERGMVPIAGDTDSLFIGNCSVEEFAAFTKWCNDDLYPRLLTTAGCKPEFRCIELAYEKCYDRLIAPRGNDGDPASKRYAGSFLHAARIPALPVCPIGETYDPKKYSKPEIKGLEYMRGDSLRYTRRMQYEAIMQILAGEEDSQKLEAWVLAKRNEFFNSKIPAEDIAKSMGISKALDQYKTSGPHVRIARAMEARGEDVGEGTRIGYITTDGRKSPTEVIPVEEFDGTNFDRWFYWNKAIYPATMRVLAGAFPDKPWERWVARRPKPVLAGQMPLLC